MKKNCRKHWVLRILVSLILGAVTTVIIAWSFGWLNRIQDDNVTAFGILDVPNSHVWHFVNYNEIGSRAIWGMPYTRFKDISDLPPGLKTDEIQPGSIGGIPNCFQHGKVSTGHLTWLETGWPFLALGAEVDGVPGPGPKQISWAIEVPELRKHSYSNDFADELVLLPLQPLPLGFALDTAIYGAFWFCVLFLRSLAKRTQPLLSWRLGFVVSFILLSIGAINTVAVAWMCAMCVDKNYNFTEPGDAYGTDGYPNRLSRWLLHRRQEPGAMELNSILFLSLDGPTGGSNTSVFDICPTWAGFVRPPMNWIERNSDGSYVMEASKGNKEYEQMESWGFRSVDGRGWPMLSMWSGRKGSKERVDNIEWYKHVPEEVVSGILLKKYYMGEESKSSFRILPLAPIWSGFIIDTLFYAFLWSGFAVFILGPKITVRTWRQNRGRCPKCSYDLRSDFAKGCPECGWNRKS